MISPTNQTSTTSIDDLPPEMIYELFKYLPLKDLVACSLVNKRWHSIYAGIKVHTLAVADRRVGSGTAEICPQRMFCHLAKKPLLSKLRHLTLYDTVFDLNELNRFEQLELLGIYNSSLGRVPVNLSLPRLRVLAFHYSNQSCNLSIDCPQLSTLVYPGEPEHSKRLEVKQPETVRKLETNMVGEKLVPFKNVECLVVQKFHRISQATVRLLPKLRELHYDEDIEDAFEDELRHGPDIVNQVRRTLTEFVDGAMNLRGSDFRFNFAGFQLSKEMLGQIDFGKKVYKKSKTVSGLNEYIYMKNYHLIEQDALHFVHFINYTRLLRYVTGEFPRCFSQKFTCIQRVYASAEVRDVNHFLWFLKSLRFLRTLDLENTRLGQEFYDQLPTSAHSLNCLELKGENCKKERMKLNFHFIGKLSSLFNLTINQPLSFELLPSLVSWLGRFESCHFYVQLEKERYSIEKRKHSPDWTIWKKYHQLVFRNQNPKEILNFFERIYESQR